MIFSQFIISMMKYNVNPDQLASLEASWSGFALFSKESIDRILKVLCTVDVGSLSQNSILRGGGGG